MSKINQIVNKAISDMSSGKYGKIGSKYLSIRQFAQVYGISYVTAYKAYGLLKANGAIIQTCKTFQISFSSKQKSNSKKHMLFGVHVRDISNNFYASLCNALTLVANENRINLVFMSSNNDNTQKKQILKKFLDLKCNGVINLNSFNENELTDFYKIYPLPLVFFGVNPLDNLQSDFIITDNISSGNLAAKHLISCGAKKFVYIHASNNLLDNDDRYIGFKSYLSSIGINEIGIFNFERNIITISEHSSFANFLLNYCKQEKIGIFCHHDGFAASVLNLCKKMNIAIPNEVAILGYDDLPLTQYTTPKISSFSYDFKEIAKSCIDNLLRRINNNNKQPQKIVFSTYLMIRNSTKSNE